MDFDDPDIRVERDGDTIRQVIHLAPPFRDSSVDSPRDLAVLYLHVHAGYFHIDRSSLPSVPGMPALALWLRMLRFLRGMPLLGTWLWSWPAAGLRLNPVPRQVIIRNGESVAVIFQQVLRVNLMPGYIDFP